VPSDRTGHHRLATTALRGKNHRVPRNHRVAREPETRCRAPERRPRLHKAGCGGPVYIYGRMKKKRRDILCGNRSSGVRACRGMARAAAGGAQARQPAMRGRSRCRSKLNNTSWRPLSHVMMTLCSSGPTSSKSARYAYARRVEHARAYRLRTFSASLAGGRSRNALMLDGGAGVGRAPRAGILGREHVERYSINADDRTVRLPGLALPQPPRGCSPPISQEAAAVISNPAVTCRPAVWPLMRCCRMFGP